MLQLAEDWMRIVVDTAIDGVILVDAEGAVQVFNPACEKLFGYAASEMIGKEADILMPSAFTDQHDADGSRESSRSKVTGGSREVVGQRKDGTTFPIALSVGEAKRGGELLYVGIVRDMTEQKQAEEQRQLFIEQFIASSEERGHFSYVASHDLQEHLRMVLSFTTLLSEEYGAGLDGKARQYLSLTLNAAEQMRELVDDLLEYGRSGAEFERERTFDGAEEVRTVLETLAEPIRESGAEISCAPLPPLFGNPVRFRRLMQNLIGNGMKYVSPQTTPRIQVSAEEEHGCWHFRVTDNGIGIDPAYFETIFKPFKRLHTRSQYSGSGLGLPICKKIVAGFGGSIWVQSQTGVGSTFHFTIPKRS